MTMLFATACRTRVGRLLAATGLAASMLVVAAGPASAAPTGSLETVAGTGAPGLGAWPAPGTTQPLDGPHGLAYDPNHQKVYIADTDNCQVLVENVITLNVNKFAGVSGACAAPDPAGTAALAAHLNHPHGVAYDQSKNLLYIADRDNGVIQVVDLNLPGHPIKTPINLTAAAPCGPVGVAVDQTTSDLYVADQTCDVVWKAPFGGAAAVYAGVLFSAGFAGDGAFTPGLFNGPSGVTVDYVGASGTLYVADQGNNEIRSIDLATTKINAVVGVGPAAGVSADGSPALSPISGPGGVRLDANHSLFYDEKGDDLVRVVPGPGQTNAGKLETIAGTTGPGVAFPYSGTNPATGAVLGQPPNTPFNGPHSMALVPTGPGVSDVWFSDTGNHVVNRIVGVAAAAGAADTGNDVPCLPDPAGVGTCPDPPTQPGGLDHYLCYQVQDDAGFAPQPVNLQDQFGTDDGVIPQTTSAATAVDHQMCNPVTKTLPTGVSYPVSNPDVHQLCFADTRPLHPTAVTVTVKNQFGSGDLAVGQATRLCLPSWKYDPNALPGTDGSVAPPWPTPAPPAPTGLEDHYQCYDVNTPPGGSAGFSSKPAALTLQDQFGTYQSVAVGDPVELCAPVTKTVVSTGQRFPASALDGPHLLCYAVNLQNPLGAVRNVLMGNQFAPAGGTGANVALTNADQLCLPSFKTVDNNPQLPEVRWALALPVVGALVAGGWVLSRRARSTTSA
jgi:sugar lactone lactonase YvrE